MIAILVAEILQLHTTIKDVTEMLHIDTTSKIPIYKQIYHSISTLIVKGILKENDQLPSTRVLAEKLNLNPNTVARAYRTMECDGIVYASPGKGFFVAKQNGSVVDKLMKDFEELVVQMLDLNINYKALIDTIQNIEKRKNI